MKLKELLKVLDLETLFKVRVDGEIGCKTSTLYPPTIQCMELKNYMDNEVESVMWTERHGIVVLISNEKSPQVGD